MKAAVLFETGKPLEIVEGINIPDLQKGQVLVKVKYSGLCHSQLMEISGGRGEDKYLPHMLGHEGVGVVEKIGEGVTKVSIGDTVIIGWIKGEGLDAPGGLYPHENYIINSGSATTLSEKTIVAENRLVALPNSFPEKVAILLGCALPTGMGLVINELQPQKHKKIAIFGLGGIGMSALVAASTYEPEMVIVIDTEDHKLKLAAELGATYCINARNNDVLAEIEKLSPGGVDYSIEAAGSTETIEMAFESVKDGGGECIFASHPANDLKISLEPHAFHRGKSIRGTWGGGVKPDIDIPNMINLLSNNNIHLHGLISKEYSLNEINVATQELVEGKIIRALICL